ncbi:M15 family metallopeptidase [Nostoc punctiforme FACHB-252]|uniref:M15 family metallopeptidase n=1 Tax=Nostoc punctiforme FACHB-252 TaxID=1357509 RepID=A0ABR8HMN5_NOSPU|nr:M15 family metallopeptidase [Nostoc punctiforme]MBD2616315.1 M15 family metallopeptidase [Nostoc punctiforme FACHB-252]
MRFFNFHLPKIALALSIILIVVGIIINGYAIIRFLGISNDSSNPTISKQQTIIPSPSTILPIFPQSTVIPSPNSINSNLTESLNKQKFGHFRYLEGNPQQMIVIASYAQGEYQRFERLAPESALALMKLIYAARENGVWIIPVSGFRTIADQEKLFRNQIQRQTSPEAAAKISAPPGYSEHHTGYALDLTDGKMIPKDDITYKFTETEAFKWLKLNAEKFGFELSFPENNPQGVSYEPWHWRFIGSPTAKEIFRPTRKLAKRIF